MGRFEEGLAVRKAVMGDEYVERSFREADEFTRPFQELVTEYAWGRCGPGRACRARCVASSRWR